MPVRRVFNPICDNCDFDSLMYAPTEQDAATLAILRGWSIYPLLCSGCVGALKERLSRESKDGGTVRDSGEGSERA